MEVVGVALDHLHGFEVLETGLLADFVLAVIGIAGEVAYIGDVPHVPDLVSEVDQVAVDHIEGEEGPYVAEVHVAVDGGSADVHPHVGRVVRLETLFFARERIAQVEVLRERGQGACGGGRGIHGGWCQKCFRSRISQSKDRPTRLCGGPVSLVKRAGRTDLWHQAGYRGFTPSAGRCVRRCRWCG